VTKTRLLLRIPTNQPAKTLAVVNAGPNTVATTDAATDHGTVTVVA